MPHPQALIGVCADRKSIDGQPFHAVGEKYLRAVAETAGGVPLIIPALSDAINIPALLAQLDGIFLTGSPSNVHPRRYATAASPEHEPYDIERDALTFDLIQQALALGLPLFAVCRGLQELNVALGGTLHPALHNRPDRPDRLDHRRPDTPDLDLQYGPQHTVKLSAEGQLRQILGVDEIQVNSLHRQGIDQLAPRLTIEAQAPDGVIEAVRVTEAEGFALAVQWHPEYKAEQNPDSVKLFQAFGAAARAYAAR
jgi:putative glutamine amidotransferase